MNFGATADEQEGTHACALIGRLLSPVGLDAAANILKRAATEPKTRQRMLEIGFWGAWLKVRV
jgi:hypothetical protein